MKIVMNKIAIDKFGAHWAYVKLIEYVDIGTVVLSPPSIDEMWEKWIAKSRGITGNGL